MSSEQDRYNAALFVGYLEQQLEDAESVDDAIVGALKRFSPDASTDQVAAYTDSICDTITDASGELFANWKDLVIAEHAA